MEQKGLVTKYSLVFYWIVPLLLGVFQAVYNLYFEILPWGISVLDGTLFGFLMGAYGMAIWFVVRYNSPEEKPFAQLLTTHLASALILALVWVYSATFVARTLMPVTQYVTYLENRLSNRIFIGFIFYTLMAVIFYLNIFYRRNREKTEKEKELKQELREAVLRALKSQINPHFLFNNLNSLTSLISTNPDKAIDFVKKLSEVYRYVLDQKDHELVALDTELKFLESYIFLQKIRFETNLDVLIDVESKNYKVIPLSLQMMVDNAIKHNEISDRNPLLVRVFSTDDQYLTVENKLQKKAGSEGNGSGIQNISDRYEFFTDRKVKISFTSDRFRISIPLLTD